MRRLLHKCGNYCLERGVIVGINYVVNAPSIFQLNKLENEYLFLVRFLFVKQFEACFESASLRVRCLCVVKLKVKVFVLILGYNDWVIHFQNGGESITRPQLGLGGDVDGGLSQGPVKDTAVKRPADMIWICDVPSIPQNITPNFNANCDPADVKTISGHSACPANRQNGRTDVLFCDGHVESPKRNDLRSPTDLFWRARWNNDNNPHTEYGNWQGRPAWINTLDQ